MSYIADLMARMDSPDDNVMFQAYREAERLFDPALIPEATRTSSMVASMR